jgi:DNA end-binding protein Ku
LEGLALPKQNVRVEDGEVALAEQLIEGMTGYFQPEQYKDTYREGLLALIDKRLGAKKVTAKPRRRETSGDVVDLMTTLKTSSQRVEGKHKKALAA